MSNLGYFALRLGLLAGYLVAMAAVLFGAAGTLAVPMFWSYLAVFAVLCVAASVAVLSAEPGSRERTCAAGSHCPFLVGLGVATGRYAIGGRPDLGGGRRISARGGGKETYLHGIAPTPSATNVPGPVIKKGTFLDILTHVNSRRRE